MKATEGPQIVTFDCNAAATLLQVLGMVQPICPACDQQVTPCQLGALFNGHAWHKSLPCLIAMTDQLKLPQAELTDKAKA